MNLFFFIVSIFLNSSFAQSYQPTLTVGSSTPTLKPGIVFQVNSTTKGSLPCPIQTTIQIEARSSTATVPIPPPLQMGDCVFNSDTKRVQFYDGAKWTSTSTGAATGLTSETCRINNSGTPTKAWPTICDRWMTSSTLNGAGFVKIIMTGWASTPGCQVTAIGTNDHACSIYEDVSNIYDATRLTVACWDNNNQLTSYNNNFIISCAGEKI